MKNLLLRMLACASILSVNNIYSAELAHILIQQEKYPEALNALVSIYNKALTDLPNLKAGERLPQLNKLKETLNLLQVLSAGDTQAKAAQMLQDLDGLEAVTAIRISDAEAKRAAAEVPSSERLVPPPALYVVSRNPANAAEVRGQLEIMIKTATQGRAGKRIDLAAWDKRAVEQLKEAFNFLQSKVLDKIALGLDAEQQDQLLLTLRGAAEKILTEDAKKLNGEITQLLIERGTRQRAAQEEKKRREEEARKAEERRRQEEERRKYTEQEAALRTARSSTDPQTKNLVALADRLAQENEKLVRASSQAETKAREDVQNAQAATESIRATFDDLLQKLEGLELLEGDVLKDALANILSSVPRSRR